MKQLNLEEFFGKMCGHYVIVNYPQYKTKPLVREGIVEEATENSFVFTVFKPQSLRGEKIFVNYADIFFWNLSMKFCEIKNNELNKKNSVNINADNLYYAINQIRDELMNYMNKTITVKAARKKYNGNLIGVYPHLFVIKCNELQVSFTYIELFTRSIKIICGNKEQLVDERVSAHKKN